MGSETIVKYNIVSKCHYKHHSSGFGCVISMAEPVNHRDVTSMCCCENFQKTFTGNSHVIKLLKIKVSYSFTTTSGHSVKTKKNISFAFRFLIPSSDSTITEVTWVCKDEK